MTKITKQISHSNFAILRKIARCVQSILLTLLLLATLFCYMLSEIVTSPYFARAVEESVEDSVEESPPISDQIPDLYIKAINPGYTVDGKSNVGEMIEIARKNADTPLSLAGTTISYTNSSGKDSVLLEFPEHSWFKGETLLLRLASSPDSELANENYTKTLAMSAGLHLNVNGETVDEICWTGKEDCVPSFNSAKPTTLVRNLATGQFEHQESYEPALDPASYYLEPLPDDPTDSTSTLPPQCQGLEFSEILSYYDTSKEEQFIELYNPKSEPIPLDGCQIRYKNKDYALKGIVNPDGYFAYYPDGFNLTKNPTNSNTLELIDANGANLDKLIYSNGQRKGTAYAQVGYNVSGQEIWKITYAPTPGEPNNYQEFKTCEEGKVINQATGNCVKVATVKSTVCKEGYYLNPLTGRCNKNKTTSATTCKDGYELNPETGRCRKIKQNNGADYELTPDNYEEQSSFIALYAVLGVLGAGALYLIFEFRHSIAKFFRKIFRRR